METLNPIQVIQNSGSAPPAAESAVAGNAKAEFERISEYEEQGMREGRPFPPHMVAVQADMMRTAKGLEADLEKALDRIDAIWDDATGIERQFKMYVATLKRIGQYADFEISAPDITSANL